MRDLKMWLCAILLFLSDASLAEEKILKLSEGVFLKGPAIDCIIKQKISPEKCGELGAQVFFGLQSQEALGKILAEHTALQGFVAPKPPPATPFEECIRADKPWSECYNTHTSNHVKDGYSGFYADVYKNKMVDQDSIWVPSPAELATSSPVAR